MTDDDWELLTVPEAARLLRIGRNLAYDLIARHELPCVRLGRVIRVPRFALMQWLERESTGVTNDVDIAPRHPKMRALPAAPPRRSG